MSDAVTLLRPIRCFTHDGVFMLPEGTRCEPADEAGWWMVRGYKLTLGDGDYAPAAEHPETGHEEAT